MPIASMYHSAGQSSGDRWRSYLSPKENDCWRVVAPGDGEENLAESSEPLSYASFVRGIRAASREPTPSALARLRRVIEESRALLDLPNNWDDNGSPSIAEATWRRATEFLERHARWAWNQHRMAIDPPDITPGPEGSIDLDWDNPRYRMLINIPADPIQLAGFYGDDRGGISIKGKLDTSLLNKGLLDWLVRPS